MNKRDFVKNREPDWKKFEKLVDRRGSVKVEKTRSREIGEYSRLLRAISNDLATVRSRGWGEDLAGYLNHLVTRGYTRFYRETGSAFKAVGDFLAVGFPQVFRKNIWYFWAAALLFFGPFFITWAIVQNNPAAGTRLVPESQLQQAAMMYDRDVDDFERAQFDESRSAMGGFYVWNNGSIALRSFVGGIFFGVVSVYIMLQNGLAIGTMAGYIIAQSDQHAKAFTSFVIGHGSFELTAIAVAGGAGLILGDALLHPRQHTRLEALKVRGLEAVKIGAGAASMIGVAAIIEAFWSPAPLPSILKYVVGVLLWLVVVAYLALAGRGRATE